MLQFLPEFVVTLLGPAFYRDRIQVQVNILQVLEIKELKLLLLLY